MDSPHTPVQHSSFVQAISSLQYIFGSPMGSKFVPQLAVVLYWSESEHSARFSQQSDSQVVAWLQYETLGLFLKPFAWSHLPVQAGSCSQHALLHEVDDVGQERSSLFNLLTQP
mmetsp:Transcript_12959/g.31588  ORF Transcript_12959/g.31588 Transcript_12959/m.31588 type:complete len:114 (+) Transcript_12959:666-1007(+)